MPARGRGCIPGVAEVGVHVQEVVVAVLDGVPHRLEDRRPQAELARPVDHVDIRQGRAARRRCGRCRPGELSSMTRIEAVRRVPADRFHQRPEVVGLVVGGQRDQEPGGVHVGRRGWIGHGQLFPCGCVDMKDGVSAPGSPLLWRGRSVAYRPRADGAKGFVRAGGLGRTRRGVSGQPGDFRVDRGVGARRRWRTAARRGSRGRRKAGAAPGRSRRPANFRPARVDRVRRPPREEGRPRAPGFASRRRHLLVKETSNDPHAGLWPCTSR